MAATPTPQDDVITGTDQRDVIDALAGNDQVTGLAGSDELRGSDGDDQLYGGDGDDLLYGGAGNDIIEAGLGQDSLYGGDGNDDLRGRADGDLLYGGRGDDMFSAPGIFVIDTQLADMTFDFARDRQYGLQVYDAFLVRTAHDLLIVSGDGRDYVPLGTVRLNDLEFQTSPVVLFQTYYLYDKFMGRKPTTDEYLYWQGRSDGGVATTVRNAILDSAEGAAVFADRVQATYRELTGRAATSTEIQHWRDVYHGQANYSDMGYRALRSGIIGENQDAVSQVISGEYQTFFGRAPTGIEIALWKGHFASTPGPSDPWGYSENFATVGTLIDALMTDPSGFGRVLQLDGTSGADVFVLPAGFTNVHIRGFDPTQDRISFAGTAFAAVDPRDPSLARQVWDINESWFDGGTMKSGGDVLIELDATHRILIEGTGTFSRFAALDREQYLSGTTKVIDDYYQAYFGRYALTSEISTWNHLFEDGATYDTLTGTLLTSAESSAHGTQHLSGTAGADQFTFAGGTSHAVISGFDPAADTIVTQAWAPGLDPMTVAREVKALDGGIDVLIELGGDHTLLIEAMTLASLETSNFVF